MSTKNPSSKADGEPDPLEVRLRHALVVVAASTPVSDPAPGDAPIPQFASPDRPSPRSPSIWRIVAAAAVLLVVVVSATVIAGRHDPTTVELAPVGGTPGRSTEVAPISPDYRLSDHWHEAYGFDVCGTFLGPLADTSEDLLGIHTHGDGLIHIHPFSAESSGPNATLGLFGDQVGVELLDDGWKLPNGSEYRTGRATCGGQPADVVVARWSVGDPATTAAVTPVAVYTENFDAIVFDADRQAYTFAVVPRGTTPPPPPSIPTLDQTTDVPSPSDLTVPPS